MVNNERVSLGSKEKNSISLSVYLFGKLILLIFLISKTLGVKETPTSIERMLIHSFFIALDCKDPKMLGNQTIALSPFRMIQAYALLRRLWKEPNCETGREINFSTFNVNVQSTWNVCSAGECRNKVCRCMKFVEGKYCTKFTGKCWLLYCKLTRCSDKVGPVLHCSCDSNLSKTPVVTKQYWYDEGLETSYRPPPAGWKDDTFYYEIVGKHIITLVSKTENMYLRAEELAVKLIDGSNLKEMNAAIKKTTPRSSLTTKLLKKVLPSKTKTTKKTTPKFVTEQAAIDYVTEKIPADLMEKRPPSTTMKKITNSTKKNKYKLTGKLVEKAKNIASTTTTTSMPKNTVLLVEKQLPLNTPPSYYFGKVGDEMAEELDNDYDETYDTDKFVATPSKPIMEYIDRSNSGTKTSISKSLHNILIFIGILLSF